MQHCLRPRPPSRLWTASGCYHLRCVGCDAATWLLNVEPG